MQTHVPAEIKAHHRARVAAVYVRQSSDLQVQSNTGSTDYQRAQARFPAMWGWLAALIEVNEQDLGLSGSAAEHRLGYMNLLQRIERGEIGALFLADMTRGGRNAEDWLRLLNLCRIHDVLIVVDGKTYDVRDNSERLLVQLLGTLTAYSDPSRSPVPIEAAHRFRRKPITRSERSRTLIPSQAEHPAG